MKKLTWALLSLMLFLGLGVAFAQNDEGGGETPTVTVPAPTFTPADGATVTPGDMIMFEVSRETMMAYQMVVFAYAFDETADLQPSFMEVFQAMQAEEGEESGLDCKLAVCQSGQWMPYEGIPTDAAVGSLKMRVRMAYAVENPEDAEAMPELVYSDEAVANYTVVAATPAPTPSFTPATGATIAYGKTVAVSIAEEEESDDYWIYYVIDQPDFKFSTYTLDEDIEDAGAKIVTSGSGIKLTKSCTIKAATCKVSMTMEGNKLSAWSEVATASYTVGAPQKPTFDPEAGEVVSGTKVAIKSADNPTYGSAIVNIYYTTDGSVPTTSSTQYNTKNPELIEITDAMTIKAIAVDAKDNTIVSEVAEAAYTIKAAPVVTKPEAPTFNPDGGEVEDGTPILLTNGTESDATPLPIYYNFKTAAALTNIKTKTALDAEDKQTAPLSAAKLYTSAGILIKKDQTINAATASIDAEGNVTWSEVVTKPFTYKKPEVVKPEAPTFNPDGGEVGADDKITIATTTPGAKIYYINGTTASFVNLTTEEDLDEAANALVPTAKAYSASYKPTLSEFSVETPGAKCSISAAAVMIAADGALTWSDPTTKEFTVKGGSDPEPVVDVAIPVISPANDAIVHMGDMVTITCDTKEAEIYYTTDGTAPYGENDVKESALKYTEPFALTESMLVKQGNAYSLRIRAVAKKGNVISTGDGAGYVVYPNAPTFNPVAGAVEEGTKVAITCVPTFADIYYTIDGTTPTEEDSPKYTEPIEVTAAMTIKAVVVLGQYQTTGSAAYAVKPAAPTFSPASGAVDFGTKLTITCATEDAWLIYTTDGSEPSEDNENVHYYNEMFKPMIPAPVDKDEVTIKAVSFIYDGDDVLYSDVVTATYTFNPIEAWLLLTPMKDDTVGMNVGTGIEFGFDGWEEYPATVYYTVDGTTEPSKTAYDAQSDKENGAIKMLTVKTKEYEYDGETYTEIIRTDGHALAITFKEATRLKAIGYITVAGQNVTTELLEETLQIKAETKPAFSLADGAEVTLGSKLVIENPNPYPEMPALSEYPEYPGEDATEEELAAYEEEVAAWQEAYTAWGEEMGEYEAVIADIPTTIMYFSFDGTEPTSAAYYSQPEDAKTVFKTQEGQDVSIFFRKDARGYYAYVPEILGYFSPADTLRLGADVSAFTLKAMAVTTESEEGEGGDEPMPLSVKGPGEEAAFMYGSDFAVAEYKVVAPAAATLTFNPASGSEIEENTAVAITANQNVEIFYMMFESEAAAKAAAWDQEKALSYSSELQPVPTKEKNTIKAAYAYEGSDIVEPTFSYATYTVKELPAIELTFNPASGSEVEDNTTVTVTANREVEIFYNLYADKAAADADKETFMANAKEVTEDGMPVITKAAPYLRCAVTDRGEMKYFDATYKIKEVANEGEEELAGVSVYPNPSNGLFNLELPVAATVEVFASNGVLVQRMTLGEGNATLNIERSGIYFLRITGEGRTTVKRLIVR